MVVQCRNGHYRIMVTGGGPTILRVGVRSKVIKLQLIFLGVEQLQVSPRRIIFHGVSDFLPHRRHCISITRIQTTTPFRENNASLSLSLSLTIIRNCRWCAVQTIRVEPVQITGARRSRRGPRARGPDYVTYVFVFLGSIIICQLHK